MEIIKTNSELRQESRGALKGNWGLAIMLFLIYTVVSCLISYTVGLIPYVGTIISILLVLPLGWGFIVTFLKLVRGNEVEISTLFDGYKDYQRVTTTMLLTNIQIFLWALLLIVPGIIKSYSYAMVPYLLADTDKKDVAAIHTSRMMMEGYKMKLFLMDLGFVGLVLLSLLLAGIPLLWVYPYWVTARAKFYENIKTLVVAEA